MIYAVLRDFNFVAIFELFLPNSNSHIFRVHKKMVYSKSGFSTPPLPGYLPILPNRSRHKAGVSREKQGQAGIRPRQARTRKIQSRQGKAKTAKEKEN